MLIRHITTEQQDQTITLNGWINHIRSSGKVAFIELRDGSNFMQCVAEEKVLGEEKYAELISCGIETSLSLT